jgi:hypothetical protein
MESFGVNDLNGDSKILRIVILVGTIIIVIGLIIRILYNEDLALFITPLLLAALVFASMHFQGIPMSIESSLGQSVKKVSHFTNDGGKRKSVPKEWRLKLIDNVLNNKKDRVRAICGECNNIDSIRYALEKGFPVELMCGSSVKDNATRSQIKNLLEKYPDKFSVFILDKRPRSHSTMLGNNILLESVHRYDAEYDKAILIENANNNHVLHFISQFENKKPKRKATIDDVEKMGLYNEEGISVGS